MALVSAERNNRARAKVRQEIRVQRRRLRIVLPCPEA